MVINNFPTAGNLRISQAGVAQTTIPLVQWFINPPSHLNAAADTTVLTGAPVAGKTEGREGEGAGSAPRPEPAAGRGRRRDWLRGRGSGQRGTRRKRLSAAGEGTGTGQGTGLPSGV